MPYLRFDLMHANLDPYKESGDENWTLKYNSTKFNSLTTIGGLRSFYEIQTNWGMLLPELRLEYKRGIKNSHHQVLSYIDDSDKTYTITESNSENVIKSGAVGLKAKTNSGLIFDCEYSAFFTTSLLQSQRVRANIIYKF